MRIYRVLDFGSMLDYYPRNKPLPHMEELLAYENDETEGYIEFKGTFQMQESDLPIECTVEEFLFVEYSDNEKLWERTKCQINAVELYKREVLSDIQMIEDEPVQHQKIYFHVHRIIEIEQIGKEPFEKRRSWYWFHTDKHFICESKETDSETTNDGEGGTTSITAELSG